MPIEMQCIKIDFAQRFEELYKKTNRYTIQSCFFTDSLVLGHTYQDPVCVASVGASPDPVHHVRGVGAGAGPLPLHPHGLLHGGLQHGRQSIYYVEPKMGINSYI